MKATIIDVANKAKVSVGTASRVLNQHQNVSPERVEAVVRAVSELKYRPLRNRNSVSQDQPLAGKNIGLILLGMDNSLVSLPVVAGSIHGVEKAVSKTGGTLLFADLPHLNEKCSILDNNRLDGVILKGALQGDTIISQKDTKIMEKLRSMPCVWLLGRPRGCWGDVVGANDEKIGYLAASYLLTKGHRKVAFINPKPDHVSFMARQMSFIWWAQQGGAEVVSLCGSQQTWELPLKAAFDDACVEGLIEEFLRLDPKPTAIFTPADSITSLVYHVLISKRIKIGRDVSLISANNEGPIIKTIYPPLVTIDIHSDIIGAQAVNQLLWRISNPNADSMIDIRIDPDIVEGKSVASI